MSNKPTKQEWESMIQSGINNQNRHVSSGDYLKVRELEILKAALEGDIIRQKEAENRDHPAWKHWLEDSEKLLKKVNQRLWDEKLKKSMLNNLKGGRG